MHWARPGVLAAAVIVGLTAALAPTAAQAETRTLKLYFTHTKESADITFKRNGRYIQSGLNKLNRFLRDHRRNEPTRMDPELFDLVWEVYQASGARNRIHVVSAYRSPATNAMLRRTRGGQASKSQHTLGKAMDFFIPGVPTSKLRELGFKLQGGGVGFYPKSATPFVHLDTGSVRAWPRMSRSQLTRLFPDGKTLHLPPDGRRLPGYEQALAAYNARERSGQVPTFGRSRSRSNDRDTERTNDGGNLLANLFGNRNNNDDAGESRTQQASRPAAPSRQQAAPETPRTVLASLSRRDLPRPGAAPRRQLNNGVPVTIAPAPAQPSPPAATVPAARVPVPQAIIPGVQVGGAAPQATPQTAPTDIAPVQVAPDFTPPVPQSRPTVLVASAEPPAIRRSADQIEASAAIEQVVRDEPSALLAAADAEAPAQVDPLTQLASVLPIPSLRATTLGTQPVEGGEQGAGVPTTLAAYAPSTVEPMVPPQVSDRPVQLAAPDGRGDRIVVPTPRPEPAINPRALAALDSGVNTTAKTARASRSDAVRAPAPIVPIIPAEQINPARFGDWTVSVASVTAEGRAVERPEFIKNATRNAPEAVYTAGFSKAPTPDPNRLSGNAVTFLAVARFEGNAGGDGQPLQLRIPATN